MRGDEVLPLSPPGSRHLRGLAFTAAAHQQLTRAGASTLLFRPANQPSPAARRYIQAGKHLGVHTAYGVYLRPELRTLGIDLLPLGALTSMTLLGAETVGRAYGGGMLKLEPREADRLPVPEPAVLQVAQAALTAIHPQVATLLGRPGGLAEAVTLVDDVLLIGELGIAPSEVTVLRDAHAELTARRAARGGAGAR